MPFAATRMQLQMIILSEVSQKEKDKYNMILLIFAIQKNGTNGLIYKAEIETQVQRANLWLPRRERGGGMNWEIGLTYRYFHI